jgi:hypothetical protein
MKLHVLAPAAALALAAASPSAAYAQAEPGDMVRVWAGQGRQEGIVVATAADSLRLAVFRSDTVVLAWTDVRRIDVSTGRETPRKSTLHGMIRGIEYGAPIGAATGLAYGGTFCHIESGSIPAQGTSGTRDRRGCGAFGYVVGTVVGAVGGGAVGGGLGALYGAWKPRPHWRRARPRPAVAMGAAPGGVALAVDLRF